MKLKLMFIAVLLQCSMWVHADDRERIVGNWQLVSVLYEDAVTKERTPVLGEHPKGYQIATQSGRWLALVTGEGRAVPTNDLERSNALRSMISYTGHFRVEDGRVITKVEAAWNESWVGTEQIRAYDLRVTCST